MEISTLRKGMATAVFVVAGAIGAAVWAHDSAAQGGPFPSHAMSHDGGHLARMAAHVEAAANATPEQKAQIDALVAQAAGDLKALHTQGTQLHQQLHVVLTQDSVDRTALESVRLAQMQMADQASQRLTKLLADVADVLTPQQRRDVVAKMQAMHGAH